jgi:hypothetical protein
MKASIESCSYDKSITVILSALCKYCYIPENDELYASRIKKTLFIVNKLLSLGDDYAEIEQLQTTIFTSAIQRQDNSAIKFSIALKKAMDIILEDQDGRNKLIAALRRVETILILKDHPNPMENNQVNYLAKPL